MRSLFLMIMFVGMLPFAWAIPYVGILLWCWISWMTPHQLVWGFTDNLRLNLLVVVATVLGWIFSNESKKIPTSPTAVIFYLLVIWSTVSTIISMSPGTSWPLWERHIKTFVLIFMILILMQSRVRIHSLVWVVVISIGYFAVQGGLIAIISAGGSHIAGPAKTQIGDNNHLALAMVTILPLMNFLRIQSENRLIQLGMLASMVLGTLAVLSTYSRGGFISLCAMFVFLWLKGKNKILILLFALIVFLPAIQFMPDKWTDRMDTIKGASQSDSSFIGRLRSWETAFNLALKNPLFGGGFSATQDPKVYQRYKPLNDATNSRAAHSIYFQVLGDLGFAGLMLYLILILMGWLNASTVIRLSKGIPQLEWARDLAAMLQVSVIGFVVGGAALSMAYYDMFLTLIAILELLRGLVVKHLDNIREGIQQNASARAF